MTDARAADDSIEHQFDSSFDYFLPSEPPQSPDVATTQQPPPGGTVSAGIPQTPAHLTPAQQQVNIAFPGALSSSQGSGVGNPTESGSASFVLAQEEEVVTQAKQRFRSQSEPPETAVEPRGSRGGRRPGAGRPPGRGRGRGGRT